MLRFHVLLCKNFACCWLCSSLFTGSRVPSLAVSFTGSRVPSLTVSLSSLPFGTCFNQPTIHQPTIHPLGLKASVVHDHCKRCRCGHRMNNLLKTLDVKGSQYPPLRRALCLRKHKLHLVTRLANQPGSNPTFTLEHSRARASLHSRICCIQSFTHLSELISLS